MSKYTIDSSTLTSITNNIRTINGSSSKIATTEIENNLNEIGSEIDKQTELLNLFADKFIDQDEIAIVTRTTTQLHNDEVTSIGNYAFYDCTSLTIIDLSNVTSIGDRAFSYCNNLATVIIRSNTMCTLSTYVFTNTPIASGTGYIYVPRVLVDSYKTAKNWSTYANQIRAIEDYPDICGGNV